MPQDDNRKADTLREIEQLAARFDLTLAEYVILHLVHYEARFHKDVVGYAAGLWKAMGFPLQPRSEYDNALASLITKGHLQVINDASLECIREMLDMDPAIGPTDGLPRIGTVHFTLHGLAVHRQVRELRIAKSNHKYKTSGVLAAPVYDGNRCTIYASCVCHAIKFAKDLDSTYIALPEAIGPWRCRWWDKYESGFRVVCEFPDGLENDS